MPNQLSNELLTQLFNQESDDPFLTLVTLTHADLPEPIRLVNNTKNITSRGNIYQAFPMKIRLPVDDGESSREFAIDFDNVGLELIEEIRSVTTQIGVTMEMVLASMPDEVQMAFSDFYINSVGYNKQKITAKVILDSFLNVEMTSERYNPSNFPGIF